MNDTRMVNIYQSFPVTEWIIPLSPYSTTLYTMMDNTVMVNIYQGFRALEKLTRSRYSDMLDTVNR
jgi:hypothetical protein